jgi:hypothetical protein
VTFSVWLYFLNEGLVFKPFSTHVPFSALVSLGNTFDIAQHLSLLLFPSPLKRKGQVELGLGSSTQWRLQKTKAISKRLSKTPNSKDTRTII